MTARGGGTYPYRITEHGAVGGTASIGFDGGSQRWGFRSRIVITHRRTTHEGLKVAPNAADGLVVSYIPLI